MPLPSHAWISGASAFFIRLSSVDSLVDVRDLGDRSIFHLLARCVGIELQGQQLLDLAQGESQSLGLLDEPQPRDRFRLVLPIARRPTCRLVKQTFSLVKPNRFDAHARLAGDFSDRQTLHVCLHRLHSTVRTVLQSQW